MMLTETRRTSLYIGFYLCIFSLLLFYIYSVSYFQFTRPTHFTVLLFPVNVDNYSHKGILILRSVAKYFFLIIPHNKKITNSLINFSQKVWSREWKHRRAFWIYFDMYFPAVSPPLQRSLSRPAKTNMDEFTGTDCMQANGTWN